MPIQIIDNFDLSAPKPIDNRFVVGPTSFYTHRDLIPYKYPGMRIWDLNDSIPYVWTGTTYSSENSVAVTGTGTPDRIPKLTLSNVIGDSLITDSGTYVGIGFSLASLASEKLHVNGNIKSDGAAGFIGFGGSITNLNASNIASGTMSLARLSNTSAGSILMSGGAPGSSTSPQWVSSSNVTVGTASRLSTVDDTTSATTHYLSFYSSTSGGSGKVSSTGLTFVPQTGNLYVSGKLGLGIAPGSDKLLVNGTTQLQGATTITGNLSVEGSVAVGAFTNKASITYGVNTARILTIPTLGGNRTFAFLEQAQTFTAVQTFSSQVLLPTGSTASPSISFSGDTNTGIYRPSADKIAFVTAGVRRLELSQGSASDFIFYSPNNVSYCGLSVYTGGYTTWTRTVGSAAEFRFYGHNFVLNIDGPMGGYGSYVNSSDFNLKENIDYNFIYGLETVEKLKPVKFDYKNNNSPTDKNNLGFIAQDLIEIIPEMVSEFDKDGEKTLGIQQDFLIPILVNSIKQLNQRVKDLEGN